MRWVVAASTAATSCETNDWMMTWRSEGFAIGDGLTTEPRRRGKQGTNSQLALTAHFHLDRIARVLLAASWFYSVATRARRDDSSNKFDRSAERQLHLP